MAARRTPVVIGRGAERAELEAALAGVDAERGSGAVVLVIGDAGIGKTRLVEDFTARTEGVLSVAGGCVEGSTDAIAYAPWTELLWWLRRSGADILGPGQSQLARLLPDLGDPPPESEGDGQILLFEAVVDALHRAASARPLAVVVEDVHWIDAASRDLLLYVTRNLRRLPLLLIITSRPGGPSTERRELFSQLQRMGATTVEVGALADPDAASVASLLMGTELDAPEVAPVVERAQGNPLFVEELVAARDGDTLPSTIRHLMLNRFDALDKDARHLVETAAIVGARLPRALLFAAVQLDGHVSGPAARDAVDAGVLSSDDTGRGYAFAHDLLREAVLSELVAHERVALHAAVAEALSGMTILDSDLDLVAERARHWDAAERPVEALEWTVAAGRQADDRYAFAAALVWYERALAWWDGVTDAAAVAGLTKVDLLFAAADAAGASGHFDRAAALAQDALLNTSDRLESVRAFARARVHLWPVGKAGLLGDIAAYALESLDELDDPVRTAFLVDYAAYLLFDGRAAEALELGPTVIDAAQRLGDPMFEVRAHMYLGQCCEQLCEADRGLAELEKAEEVARRAGLFSWLTVALYNHASMLSSIPRHAECLARLDEVAALVESHGIRRLLVVGPSLRASELVLSGDLDEARAVLDVYSDLPMEGVERDLYVGARGLLALHEGDYAAALVAFDHMQVAGGNDVERLAARTVLRAEGLAWTGEIESAADIVVETLAATKDRPEPYWLGFLTMAGLRAVADIVSSPDSTPEQVDAARERAQEIAGQLQDARANLPATFPLTDAQTLAAEAEFARLTGDEPAAHARAAADAFEQLAMPYYVSYFEWREGAAALADGDRARASRQLSSALSRALLHRYEGLERAIEQTARAGQVRLGRRAAPAEDLLSGREVEVLKLLADGMSNPDIADSLIIGRRTVRAHVSNILQKLGAASRAEAVAVAHRRNIL